MISQSQQNTADKLNTFLTKSVLSTIENELLENFCLTKSGMIDMWDNLVSR